MNQRGSDIRGFHAGDARWRSRTSVAARRMRRGDSTWWPPDWARRPDRPRQTRL